MPSSIVPIKTSRAANRLRWSVASTGRKSITCAILLAHVRGHRSAAYLISRAILIVLASGALAASLVRVAPGFGVDARALDPRFSAETLESIRREQPDNPIRYYVAFCGRLLRGDLGNSTVFGERISVLIKERSPLTFVEVGAGLTLGWSIAAVLGIAAALRPRVALLPAVFLNSALLSVPSAVVALFCALARLAPAIAIGAIVLPRAFPHVYEQLRSAVSTPAVLSARAAGMRPTRVFAFYVAPAVAAPLLAFAAISITIAFGAAIPIEALVDAPGLGQMTWRAALGRDLPVLIVVTLFLTVVAITCNTAAELVLSISRRPA